MIFNAVTFAKFLGGYSCKDLKCFQQLSWLMHKNVIPILALRLDFLASSYSVLDGMCFPCITVFFLLNEVMAFLRIQYLHASALLIILIFINIAIFKQVRFPRFKFYQKIVLN